MGILKATFDKAENGWAAVVLTAEGKWKRYVSKDLDTAMIWAKNQHQVQVPKQDEFEQ